MGGEAPESRLFQGCWLRGVGTTGATVREDRKESENCLPEFQLSVATGGSQVECVSSYWGLTQKNGSGLEGGAERAHRKEES